LLAFVFLSFVDLAIAILERGPFSYGPQRNVFPTWTHRDIVTIVFSALFVSMLIRRVHDLGLSGVVALVFVALMIAGSAVGPRPSELDTSWISMMLSLILSLIGTLALFWFLLARGQDGENKFGPAPRPGWLP
jgi:uncharacterized membrane protein YhaH (DUF805 family)